MCNVCKKERREEVEKAYNERHNEERRNRWHINSEYRKLVLAAGKRYRIQNKEQLSQKNRERRQSMRIGVLAKYGNKCECCGDENPEFLVIDHINGGGTKERKALTPWGVYIKLFNSKERLPGYRILCHNCNASMAIYGYCPHKRK